MYKILIVILISMLVAEMALGHFCTGRCRDARKSALERKIREMRLNYDVKNALRKADADLSGIRDMLHTFARQEERDGGENTWRQERDEEEYQRGFEDEGRASRA